MFSNVLSADPVPTLRGIRLSAIVASLLVLATELPAQQADDDMLVIMSGSDTIAVERVRRTASRLDGELLIKAQKFRISYAARLAGVGRVMSLDNEFRQAGADPASLRLPASGCGGATCAILARGFQ